MTYLQSFGILLHSDLQLAVLERYVALFLETLYVFHAFPQLLSFVMRRIQT